MLSVSSDVKKLSRSLDQVQTSNSIYNVSRAQSTALMSGRPEILPQILDRPSTYTVKSVQVLNPQNEIDLSRGICVKDFWKLPRNAGIAPAEYMRN